MIIFLQGAMIRKPPDLFREIVIIGNDASGITISAQIFCWVKKISQGMKIRKFMSKPGKSAGQVL